MPSSAIMLTAIAAELSGSSCVSFLSDVQLSDGLLDGSIAGAAIIACSDMGCSLPFVCSSPTARLFRFQNFGNEFVSEGFLQTAIRSGAQSLIVYGHLDCEYMRFSAKSALDQRTGGSTEGDPLLELYAAALKSGQQALWEEVGKYNVLLQLKRMLADATIGPMAAQGAIKMHGWFLSSNDAQLEVFDPASRAFIGQRTKLLATHL